MGHGEERGILPQMNADEKLLKVERWQARVKKERLDQKEKPIVVPCVLSLVLPRPKSTVLTG